MKRYQIINKIKAKQQLIEKLKSEILELRREETLLSDRRQQFVEKEEDVLVSGRPKVYEKKLVGRVHWKEKFVDEDDPNISISIPRSQAVRINGEWI